MKSNQKIHCLLGCFLLVTLFGLAHLTKKTNKISFGITEIDVRDIVNLVELLNSSS
jgi:hypothetical protein